MFDDSILFAVDGKWSALKSKHPPLAVGQRWHAHDTCRRPSSSQDASVYLDIEDPRAAVVTSGAFRCTCKSGYLDVPAGTCLTVSTRILG